MIRDVLLAHFDAYPRMLPQDAVKLLYQAVFGPEHLIRDEKRCLEELKKEMSALPPGPQKEPVYESIGNGLCRLNLRPCAEKGIPPEDICRLFIEAARGMRGDRRQLQEAVGELMQLAEEDETPFEAIELDVFLIQYRDKNCPALHHSEQYRRAYAPAYRVAVQKKVKDYLAGRRKAARNE